MKGIYVFKNLVVDESEIESNRLKSSRPSLQHEGHHHARSL